MTVPDDNQMQTTILSITNTACNLCGNKDWEQCSTLYPIWKCKKCGNKCWSE
jgi:ribosomal protein L37AE/L43A